MTLFVLFPELAQQATPVYYVSGFVLKASLLSGPSFSDYTLTYKDTFNVDYVVKFNPDWRSGEPCALTQSLWFILDECHAYISGIEVISGIFFGLRRNLNGLGYYIEVESGGGSGTDYPFSFVSPPLDYWLDKL